VESFDEFQARKDREEAEKKSARESAAGGGAAGSPGRAAEGAAPAKKPVEKRVKKPGIFSRIRQFFHDPSYTMPGGVRYAAYSEFQLWRKEKLWPVVHKIIVVGGILMMVFIVFMLYGEYKGWWTLDYASIKSKISFWIWKWKFTHQRF